MLTVAAEYPDVQFVGMTNQGSRYDDLANTHNAFANIYEGRYVAGVAAGLKMQQLIDDGEIRLSSATSARTPSRRSSPASPLTIWARAASARARP